MKNLLTILFCILIGMVHFQSNAQSIPNSSFEDWTSPLNPDNWNTYAMIPLLSNFDKLVTKDNSKSHSGSASIKITTDSIYSNIGGTLNLDTLCGVLNLGNIDFMPVVNMPLPSSLSFSSKPDSLVFYYQYLPVGIDTFDMIAILLDAAGTVAEIRKTFTQTTSTWTRYSEPFNYTGTPIQLILIFENESRFPKIQSTFWLDDIEFIYKNPSTVKEFNENASDFMIYPNPSTKGEVFVKFKSDHNKNQISVFNAMGQQVNTENSLLQQEDKMYTYKITAPSAMSNGQYFIKVNKGGSYSQTFQWNMGN